MSRTGNTIKNTYVGIIAQVVTIILNFVNRTIFIKFLGVEYLGMGGLFSNVLSMLSLAELGIGVAMVYNLYKPLAENDEQSIKAYMNFYKLAYRIIAAIILVAGLALIPLLPVIIKDKPDVDYFELAYVLFLLNTVASYLFSYKRSIFSADQKERVNTINRTIFSIILCVAHLAVLVAFKSYIIYLIVTIAVTVLSNIRVSYLCDKKYPFLKRNKERLGKTEKRGLMKHVFAQMSHKFGGVVVNGTDNILTTSFVTGGLALVGKYSNYTLFTGTLNTLINMVFNAVLPSVGNLNVNADREKLEKTYNKILFINASLMMIISCCLLVLADDFVTVWLGKEFVLSKYVVLIIVINFFVSGMRHATTVFINALGLYTKNKYKPWAEAAINLGASLILIQYMGFFGVLLGTTISTILTSFWVDPYVLYKHGFKKSVWGYFLKYTLYTGVFVGMCAAAYFGTSFIDVENIFMWIVKAILVGIICCAVAFVLFFKTEEFKTLFNMVKSFAQRIFGKIKRMGEIKMINPNNSVCEIKPKRNYGIDLLRLVSMLMVVMLHVLYQGGILTSVDDLTFKGELLWFLEILCYCAVNCFAVISGYVGLFSRNKKSGLINTWIQVIFYSVGIKLIETVVLLAMGKSIAIKSIFTAFFPLIFDTNWYFTAYFCLFFFVPFYNHIINTMERKQVKGLIAVMIALFSIVGTIKPNKTWGVELGYSFVWLSVMYIIGAYIAKYKPFEKVSKAKSLLFFLGSIGLTMISRVALLFITLKINGVSSLGLYFVTYTSPLMVIAAVSLLNLFSKLEIGGVWKKTIAFFAPTAFGVYIIHTNPVVFDKLLLNRFDFITQYNVFVVLAFAIGACIAIFLACALVDKARIYLFKLLKIDKLSCWIEGVCTNIINKFI